MSSPRSKFYLISNKQVYCDLITVRPSISWQSARYGFDKSALCIILTEDHPAYNLGLLFRSVNFNNFCDSILSSEDIYRVYQHYIQKNMIGTPL